MGAGRLVSPARLLQARGRVTGRALAAELGVSVRTVYRDLEVLAAAGVPVITGSGPGGGFRLMDGYRFPLRGLRPEEAEALLILGVPGALRDLGLDRALTATGPQGPAGVPARRWPRGRAARHRAARPGEQGGHLVPGGPGGRRLPASAIRSTGSARCRSGTA